jgi:hypothetical protein
MSNHSMAVLFGILFVLFGVAIGVMAMSAMPNTGQHARSWCAATCAPARSRLLDGCYCQRPIDNADGWRREKRGDAPKERP